MSDKTIFKKIIDRDVPADIVHEDDLCLAFHDVSPAAPTHVLIIPKKEIATLNNIAADDAALMGHIWTVIPKLAERLGLDDGYRVTVNCGAEGGQTVDHLHFHVMGGRQMKWPPG